MTTTAEPIRSMDESSLDNWRSFRVKDADYESDARQVLQAAICVMPNKALLQLADQALNGIREIDRSTDSDRVACANYRRQYVKQYNLCREHLLMRSRDGRYRGELLELLDFIKGVRNHNGMNMTGVA